MLTAYRVHARRHAVDKAVASRASLGTSIVRGYGNHGSGIHLNDCRRQELLSEDNPFDIFPAWDKGEERWEAGVWYLNMGPTLLGSGGYLVDDRGFQ